MKPAPVLEGLDVDLSATDRFQLWSHFVKTKGLRRLAEIGVYQGEFARHILANSPGIERYVMVDPWRAMSDWNKPANTDDATFEGHYRATMAATEFAREKRVVLRGTTVDVIDRIKDVSLDFVYIDGDHTLRGIAIDLIRTFPKVREGGWIAGDDFSDTIWQHPQQYEPTLVFPFAVYFAEANDMTIYALPHNQFVMQKGKGPFAFIDLTHSYGDSSVLRQVCPRVPVGT